MSFEKVFYSSFVKGVGRTVGVLTIFGSLGLLYISFTNLYSYSSIKSNEIKEEKNLKVKEENTEENVYENTEENTEEEENVYEKLIENNEIKNYENNELFKKLFDKIK